MLAHCEGSPIDAGNGLEVLPVRCGPIPVLAYFFRLIPGFGQPTDCALLCPVVPLSFSRSSSFEAREKSRPREPSRVHSTCPGTGRRGRGGIDAVSTAISRMLAPFKIPFSTEAIDQARPTVISLTSSASASTRCVAPGCSRDRSDQRPLRARPRPLLSTVLLENSVADGGQRPTASVIWTAFRLLAFCDDRPRLLVRPQGVTQRSLRMEDGLVDFPWFNTIHSNTWLRQYYHCLIQALLATTCLSFRCRATFGVGRLVRAASHAPSIPCCSPPETAFHIEECGLNV